MMKRDKKDDEESGGNPFKNLDKTTALQEAKSFHETPVIARKCVQIINKIIYVILQGESIGTTEATDAFFATTKLFQSKDAHLRKMVYLCIKEMANLADDVIIVTSSLTRDMTGKDDQFRAPAIRALCRITDASLLQSIERYMKQAIVDRQPAVSSAALVSSMHLMRQAPDVVRRWVNEAQETVNSDNVMVQYHGLGLLYQIRRNDKLAVTKLVQKYTRQFLKSPYACCFLIRVVAKLLEEDDAVDASLFDFLESCLRHKSEMVIYEAAQAIVGLRHTTPKELAPAISVLQLFCSSPKPTLRYAAVRTLNRVSIKHPAAVSACNMDLENLISDVNRSIATLAISTLLKTGSEGSVDRLMKQIGTFMSEISDEFKVVVVQAVRSLCQKFPRKHIVLMQFLSQMLREEGGFDYKKAIVDTIIYIIEQNSEAKDAGLTYLCEFIEDCEHAVLATRILHLLGREGPRSGQPSRLIRYIYNRIILENASVRAAAVSALARFGAHCESLLPSVLVLLQRSLMDEDDEVRDRATFYLNVLQQRDAALNSAYILNTLPLSVVGLERALGQYCADVGSAHDKAFDLKTVPLDTRPAVVGAEPSTGIVAAPKARKPDGAPVTVHSQQDIYIEQLRRAMPTLLDQLGPLFKSSATPIQLTEQETEYVVCCVKHTFANHIVFQFDCINTLNDQLLENVRVDMVPRDGSMGVVKQIPCAQLKHTDPSTTYTICCLPSDDPTQVMGTFGCTLRFIVKDCDPQTGQPDDDEGYADEYSLEDVTVDFGDHVQKVLKADFASAWDELGPQNELEDTYELSSVNSLAEAVQNVCKFLQMQPCERTDKVPDGKTQHVLLLSGVYRGGHDVLVRAKMVEHNGVTMQVTIRSSNAIASQVVANSVG